VQEKIKNEIKKKLTIPNYNNLWENAQYNLLCQNIICFSVLLINNDDDGEEKRERHTSTLA
jgi:hypothetical protein